MAGTDDKVQIGTSSDYLEGVAVDTTAGAGLFREGVVVSDPETAGARSRVLNVAPAADAYGQVVRVAGIVEGNDSSEQEYSPGLTPLLVTAAGDTTIYTPPAGKGWILHWSYAVPVTRGTEDAPVITIKTVDAANSPIATHYVVAAVSKRKQITMPADSRLVVNLDIAGRVPTTFDIEVLP